MSDASPTYKDTITDYKATEGDILDIGDLLTGFNPTSSAISDYVSRVDDSGGATLRVDVDGKGSANSWLDIALLQGVGTQDAINVLVQGYTYHI